MTRNQSSPHLHDPKPQPVAKLPTAGELAEGLGVTLRPPLKPSEVQRLRKALPGYMALLDDVAQMLDADAAELHLSGVTPASLLELQASYKDLRAREVILEAVYGSVYQERLQIDDKAIGLLQKIARRVHACSEDDPQIIARWQVLLGFLNTFRRGGRRVAEPVVAGQAQPTPVSPDAPATPTAGAKG